MFRRLAVISLFALLVFVGQFAYLRLTAEHRVHDCTHRLEYQQLPAAAHMIFLEGGKLKRETCSGTAIGPHAILTATHCENGNERKFWVDGQPAEIKHVLYDGEDHSIYLISGVTFYHYARVSSRPLEQTDAVFIYGNPAGEPDVLRRGYVTSVDNDDELGTYSTLDINGFYGDSGAAVFNSDGEITTVISKLDFNPSPYGEEFPVQMKLMQAMDLRFRDSQYERARRY